MRNVAQSRFMISLLSTFHRYKLSCFIYFQNFQHGNVSEYTVCPLCCFSICFRPSPAADAFWLVRSSVKRIDSKRGLLPPSQLSPLPYPPSTSTSALGFTPFFSTIFLSLPSYDRHYWLARGLWPALCMCLFFFNHYATSPAYSVLLSPSYLILLPSLSLFFYSLLFSLYFRSFSRVRLL